MFDTAVYTENSIRTYTGKIFDLKILDPESICIEDIAHALAQTARFGGHLDKLYSVAQHSFYVSMNVARDQALAGLLHDASEAYLGDMPSPFKKMLPDFKFHEDRVMRVIADKFGFQYPFHKSIKDADKGLLNAEWNSFVMKNESLPYWSADVAEKQFLAQFENLKK